METNLEDFSTEKTGLDGVSLYKVEKIPSKITDRVATLFLSGKTKYKVLGICHVDERTNSKGVTFKEYDGVLLETTTSTGATKRLVCSVNALVGLSFYKDEHDSWQPERVSAQLFMDANDIIAFIGNEFITSDEPEMLKQQDFVNGESADTYSMKPFYTLSKVGAKKK